MFTIATGQQGNRVFILIQIRTTGQEFCFSINYSTKSSYSSTFVINFIIVQKIIIKTPCRGIDSIAFSFAIILAKGH